MVYQNGEVIISPYTVYWIYMPPNIGENDKIELLKRDILIIDCNYTFENFSKLVNKVGKNVAFFYNLDKILTINKTENEYSVCSKLAKFISKLSPDKSIIHTTILNDKIRDIFRNEGLIFIEKNFNDKVGAVNIILELIKPIFSNENVVRRSFLRINVYPGLKYKIEITKNNELQLNTINGYLKDISLNGIGIILFNKNECNIFSLKEQVSIKIYTPNAILKIPVALITRKDEINGELGVSYNINDKNMIKEDTSTYLVKIIYKWIKEIVEEYGKISE